MEAGKTTAGQVVLPITFNLYAALFDREKYSRPDNLPITFGEEQASDDVGLQIASRGLSLAFSCRFGNLVDYSTEKLIITKDDLSRSLMSFIEMDGGAVQEKGESIGLCDPMTRIYQGQNMWFPDKKTGEKQNDYVMLPTYNSTGGVTAYISSFIAINSNTKHPKQAFSIVDRLMGKDVLSEICPTRGMPVHMELGSAKNGIGEYGWFLNEWNYEQYQWLCSQINAVEFHSELNIILSQLSSDYFYEEDSKRRESLVSKAYSEMEMIVGEM